MKKMFCIVSLILGLLFLTGCQTNNTNIVEKLKKRINNLDSYHINGVLEVTNDESTYKYDVDVAYEEDEKYRVSLKNQTNNHEQIILKNSTGVYVLTPSLNKSFKFQSEWPYNNSQSYLYQTIINDIENDKEATYKEIEGGYIIETKVNYSNNKELVSQKIYLNKSAGIEKVEVLDKNGMVKIKMTYKKVDERSSFSDDYFELSSNLDNQSNSGAKNEVVTTKLDNIVYPLYMPKNTYLESQETVNLDNKERVILTFSGEKPFTLIEETTSMNDYGTISVYGELEFINDTIGSISNGTASWISNGVEYYAVSDSLEQAELLEVVNSMSVLPVGK